MNYPSHIRYINLMHGYKIIFGLGVMWIYFVCLLFSVGSSFLVSISPAASPKCFLATLFPHENLLVEIQLPIMMEKMQIQFSARKQDGDLIYKKTIKKNQDRITVSVDNLPTPAQIQTIQACLEAIIRSADPSQQELLKNKTNLIWFAQFNHFSHQIEDRSQGISDPLQMRFQRIKDKISLLRKTYEQQLKIFHTQQEKQSQNEGFLEEALNEAYTLIIFESFAIVCITAIYIGIIHYSF